MVPEVQFLAQVVAIIGVLVSSSDSGPISGMDAALSPGLSPVAFSFPPTRAPWRDPSPGSLLAMSWTVEGPCYQCLALTAMFGCCDMSPCGLCWDCTWLLTPFPLGTATCCCTLTAGYSLAIKTCLPIH